MSAQSVNRFTKDNELIKEFDVRVARDAIARA